MKCLTVCQPWAWCIVHGPKCYENRNWRCNHRGPLLIHAGQSRTHLTPRVYAELKRKGVTPPNADELALGVVVGVCQVVDCVPVAAANGNPWAIGPWCIELADARALPEPIPYRGRLKLFDVRLSRRERKVVDELLHRRK